MEHWLKSAFIYVFNFDTCFEVSCDTKYHDTYRYIGVHDDDSAC